MARPSIWHERNFDREADFIVKRLPLFGGKKFSPGQLFDKTLCSTRRLRQLFEQRKIVFASGDRPAAPPGRPLRMVRAARPKVEQEDKAMAAPPSPEPRRLPRSIPKPKTVIVKHYGAGRWALCVDGERTTDYMTKTKAQALLEAGEIK